jgi:hypothetical protein
MKRKPFHKTSGRARRPSLAADPRVRDFVRAAKRFCTLIESHREFKRKDFIYEAAEAVAELQFRGIRLLALKPPIEWSRQTIEYPPDSAQRFFALRKQLGGKVGPRDRYWEIFDPLTLDSAVSFGVSSDLAEIYQDVSRALPLFAVGRPADVREAVWHWALDYLNHWGHHCASVMRPLRQLVEEYDTDIAR